MQILIITYFRSHFNSFPPVFTRSLLKISLTGVGRPISPAERANRIFADKKKLYTARSKKREHRVEPSDLFRDYRYKKKTGYIGVAPVL